MLDLNIYLCEKCGNLIEILNNNPTVNINCCNEKMKKITANTTDAATEKHIPYVNIEDNSMFIQIGEISHPMTDEHYITTIYVVDDLGNMQKIKLTPNDKPEICINFNKNAKKINVYSYCNLHGLWKKEIDL